LIALRWKLCVQTVLLVSVVHLIGCFVSVCVCVCVCVVAVHIAECVSERLDPSSPALRRPLCRSKSCPSEPANGSCSIFIKPLSLKEPYPDRGKSHSPRSRSHALSILALVPLPALLSLSHPPLPPPSICPSPLHFLSVSLSFIHTHFHLHTLRHTLSHTHI